jgi:hypothetical protein
MALSNGFTIRLTYGGLSSVSVTNGRHVMDRLYLSLTLEAMLIFCQCLVYVSGIQSFLFAYLPDLISLQLCTRNLFMYNSSYTHSVIYI